MSSDNALIERLVTQLQHDDASVRDEAAYQLGKLEDTVPPQAIAVLIEALKDPSAQVRYTVAEALAALKPPAAVDPLLEAIAHNSEETLGNIAEALGNIGNPRAVEPLINLLADTDPYVRVCAAEALGKIGDPRAVEPLLNCLSDTKETDKGSKHRVCNYAAEALRRINTLEARIAVEKFEKGEYTPKRWWQFWK